MGKSSDVPFEGLGTYDSSAERAWPETAQGGGPMSVTATPAHAAEAEGYISPETVLAARDELRQERDRHRETVHAVVAELERGTGRRAISDILGSVASQLSLPKEAVEDAIWQLLAERRLVLRSDRSLDLV
jgi:hypothetical protein